MRKIFVMLLVVVVGLLLWLGVCLLQDSRSTGLAIFNNTLKLIDPITVNHDIAFGDEPWQTLDVYPSDNSHPVAPVIVFIHGGGWNWGNKSMYYFVAHAFVARGYTVVIPDYIKYPEGHFPQFIEDGAKTLAWVKENISRYNGNPQQIYLAGHSAGAHTGALLMTDKHYLTDVGITVGDISGFAGIAGPYAFTPDSPEYIATFGEENFHTMKATSHVDGDEPPMLLLHAMGDNAVGEFNQQQLAQALRDANRPVQTRLYGEEINHINILLKLHPWFAGSVDTGHDLDEFFQLLSAQQFNELRPTHQGAN
ncbi:esterase/lipase/thioesterase family protein [Paraglaciecola sp. T6c]|uniref:alpha/beta hydrolase n=1 Tax=Pseudoalteromonas atlantica (strain T6c / ATCC BAA-1087) TaxID=3042615 RepID=UPI00005C73D9|nr:alpha/beta hydrolase [Paraglaciecola sp. T6c]ABG38808.1 esterase/lipase/thioesterase family protein [Paraglaciecola sp. T6c]